MAERSNLIGLVEEQLETSIAGIELNEGFGLFIIAGRTQLAATLAQLSLRERLGEARHCELEVHGAAEQLAELLAPDDQRPTVVRFEANDASEVDAWRPLFRRLNENRNAIIRAHPAALVLIVAEAQIEALAAEAPDLWSVAVIRVVGWLGRIELLREMARRYGVLEALTKSDRQAVIDAVRELGRAELVALVDIDDRDRRARRAFELLLGRWRESAPRSGSIGGEWEFEFREDASCSLKKKLFGWGLLHWSIERELVNFTVYDYPQALGMFTNVKYLEGLSIYHEFGVVLLPSMDEHDALARMLEARQELVHVATRVCVAAQGMLVAELNTFVRHTFDLVFELATEEPSKPWELTPGTAELAPLIRCPRNVMVHIDDSTARFEFVHAPIELGDPTQPWLPGLDARSLGVAPLGFD